MNKPDMKVLAFMSWWKRALHLMGMGLLTVIKDLYTVTKIFVFFIVFLAIVIVAMRTGYELVDGPTGWQQLEVMINKAKELFN